MEKLKKTIEGKNRWKGLESYILIIDENKKSNPNIALDNAKSILEAISKTILNDKGITYNKDSKIKFLVKKAFENLPIFQKTSKIDVERGKSIIGSLESISQKIGEFRNDHGFFSHGQDLEAKKFDCYLTDLAISASDLISSFLIISHGEDLRNRSRIYYEEYSHFNKYIDERDEDEITIGGIPISKSRALFTDKEAYQEMFLNFENTRCDLVKKLISSDRASNTRITIEELEPLKDYLLDSEIIDIIQATDKNDKISCIINEENINYFIEYLFKKAKENNLLNDDLILQMEKLFQDGITN